GDGWCVPNIPSHGVDPSTHVTFRGSSGLRRFFRSAMLFIHSIYVMYCPYIRSLSVMLSRILFMFYTADTSELAKSIAFGAATTKTGEIAIVGGLKPGIKYPRVIPYHGCRPVLLDIYSPLPTLGRGGGTMSGTCLLVQGKENGVNILKSIDEGPFRMGTLRETLTEGTKGAPHLGPERPRVYSDLTIEENEKYNTDILETNILLHGLRKDIYSHINHYTDAKDMWDNVKMLLEGSELTK
nr:integrase, catalytic region, zinc finger, CCHC-type, peptidase aspartic, catalytic [Tanacetum cinerariifolium]